MYYEYVSERVRDLQKSSFRGSNVKGGGFPSCPAGTCRYMHIRAVEIPVQMATRGRLSISDTG